MLHIFTQKRVLDCDENQFRWFEHFILVIGYLGFLFTTVFLDWFSSKNLFIILPGYVMSIAIFIVTIDFVSSRIKKEKAELEKLLRIDTIWMCGECLSCKTMCSREFQKLKSAYHVRYTKR